MFGCFSMKFMNNSCSHTKETHFLVKIPSRQIPRDGVLGGAAAVREFAFF
jgi:hypothetical protein